MQLLFSVLFHPTDLQPLREKRDIFINTEQILKNLQISENRTDL